MIFKIQNKPKPDYILRDKEIEFVVDAVRLCDKYFMPYAHFQYYPVINGTTVVFDIVISEHDQDCNYFDLKINVSNPPHETTDEYIIQADGS